MTEPAPAPSLPVTRLEPGPLLANRRDLRALVTWRRLLIGLGMAALVGASLAAVALPIPYSVLGNYGYLGVFLLTLIATGALIAPVPYLAAIVIAGTFLNPILVGLVAGLAAALGELTGYAAGLAGRSVLPETRWSRWLDRAMQRVGVLVVFAASLAPNPLFDAVGVAAGVARLPVWKFMAGCFAGKSLRFILLAWLGAPLLRHLL